MLPKYKQSYIYCAIEDCTHSTHNTHTQDSQYSLDPMLSVTQRRPPTLRHVIPTIGGLQWTIPQLDKLLN